MKTPMFKYLRRSAAALFFKFGIHLQPARSAANPSANLLPSPTVHPVLCMHVTKLCDAGHGALFAPSVYKKELYL